MSTKYQRPAGAYAGASGLGNRTKYNDDATAVPKRAISSAKMDGDLNYVVDALNQIDDASGTRASIAERLDVALNPDGTLKFSTTGALDEWVVQVSPGTLARVDNSTLTLSGGDFTGTYVKNRRVRVTVAGVKLVGDVATCTYSGGLTTLSLVDIVDEAGSLAIISAAPTQVAYGPVTSGVRGNVPTKTAALTLNGATVNYKLACTGDDLVVTRGGTEVARVQAAGVSGLAAGSVGTGTLAAAVSDKLMPVGAVMPFAGSAAPGGWLLCGGQAVSRTTYAALFAVIGVVYGAGDGSTTFNLPDLRGRSVFGLDNMNGTAASRVTSGISGITGTTLGASGGNERLHAHTHTVTDPGHAHSIQMVAQGTSAGNFVPQAATAANGGIATTQSATTGISLQNAGAGASQNMPPAVMLNYVIKA